MGILYLAVFDVALAIFIFLFNMCWCFLGAKILNPKFIDQFWKPGLLRLFLGFTNFLFMPDYFINNQRNFPNLHFFQPYTHLNLELAKLHFCIFSVWFITGIFIATLGSNFKSSLGILSKTRFWLWVVLGSLITITLTLIIIFTHNFIISGPASG